MEELARRIIVYRAAHSMSQSDFALICGLTRVTINNIENGKENLSKITRAKIELVLEE